MAVLGEDVAHGDERGDAQRAFDEHGAKAHQAGVTLAAQLFGRGARGHQRMEARDGPAGHGHEQGREEILAVDLEGGEGGQLDDRMRGHDAHHGGQHHGVEQERAEVVAGLEQDPDGRHRGHEDVQAQQPHPGIVARVEGEAQAQGDDAHDARHAQQGGPAQGHLETVDQQAEDHGQHDEQQGDGGRGAVDVVVDQRARGIGHEAVEGARHDGGEGPHHQHQGQEGKDDEQALGPQTDAAGDDLADGAALVAQGGEQGAEVMHAAEEDAADDHPDETGQPAEDGGLDGAVDGPGPGDGRKMVAQHHRSFGGHVVHAVAELVGRRGTGRIDAPDLFQPGAVDEIAQPQQGQAAKEQIQGIHDARS